MLEKCDAVSIVVPTDLHYEIVKECVNAGKHVLVEKPLTKNAEQSAELRKLAEEKGVYLTVGYLFRFNAAVQELKKRLPELGDIQYITARYMHSNKPPRKDSGVVFNFGVHLIDILSFVLEQKPKKVYCKSKSFLSEREDAAIATMDYGSFMAELEMSWLHPLKKRDMWVIGSKKKVYIDLLEQMMTIYTIEVSYDGNKIEPEQNIEIHKNEPLKEELTSFISTIDSGNFANGNDAYDTTKICELCLKSSAEGVELSNE
jgi:UDP-N-acetylglucosamine 3-dehydrogenase